MKRKHCLFGGAAAAALLGAVSFASAPGVAAPKAKAGTAAKARPKAAAKKAPASSGGLVALRFALPKPAFIGTPKNIPPGTTVEKPTGRPRPTFYAPRGTRNVALGKPVTGSDTSPIIGEFSQITDGDKEAGDGHFVEFGPGSQHVQIDLKGRYKIYGILLWHFHGEPRVYRDIVVQVADDPDFIQNVRTVFNNDQDNSSGRGVGKDREYYELAEGKLINAKGVPARYVRLYSKGSTSDDQNHYTEVEVYGLPAK